MPTFVTLASPTVADIPGRPAVFTAAAALVHRLGAAVSRDTHGRLTEVDRAAATSATG